ncbi:autotransporter outer membrane beta-barrel domain-containing protein, partial [Helicobacter sp. 12S02634-8]|uniref:autotransporter outer membrane beta-barrel domain-containing protein n=1 Tax=Helicobacter sp. 12S02634-8 TaxID=1476199 RepID=UPI00117A1A6B
NITGDQKAAITLINSDVGDIDESHTASTLTFATKRPTTDSSKAGADGTSSEATAKSTPAPSSSSSSSDSSTASTSSETKVTDGSDKHHTIGNIKFQGKIDGEVANTGIMSLTLSNSGSANLKLSKLSFISGDITTKDSANSKIQLDASALGGAIKTQGGTNAVSFKSTASTISLTSFKFEPDKPYAMTQSLLQAGISIFANDIITSKGTSKVDFKDSLYLGGRVFTTGGSANVTLSFSKEFMTKLTESGAKQLLLAGDGPEFDVITNGAGAVNNIALEGAIRGIANVSYIQGDTHIVFADVEATEATPKAADSGTDSTSGGSGGSDGASGTKTTASAEAKAIPADTNWSTYNPDDTDKSKSAVTINGHTYEDGILVRLDSSKADSLLKPYRHLYATNTTTFKIDKITNPNVYTARVYGVMVGEIDSLNQSSATTPTPKSGDTSTDKATPKKSYQAIFEQGAVFIGKLNIKDVDTAIGLSKGAKLILEDGSHISVLSSGDHTDTGKLDPRDLARDTMLQDNTIIDLATGGKPSAASPSKASFSVLTIDAIQGISNVVFRLSYDPQKESSTNQKQKADHLIINGTLAPKADTKTPIAPTSTKTAATTIVTGATAAETPKDSSVSDQSKVAATLNEYLQVYQNTSRPIIGDLRDKKILVASIKDNTDSSLPKVVFNTTSSVYQGYDLITTTFDVKKESSSGANTTTDTTTEASKTATTTKAATSSVVAGTESLDSKTDSSKTDGSKDTANGWTNYYIATTQAQIDPVSKDMSAAAITTNYGIFLANINDLNKRLGELRTNVNTQGAWARVFNGMTTSNRGESVKTYSTNVQAGYDYALNHNGAKSYLGLALSYGYNSMNAQSFSGKANVIEVGAYYSFVSDEGFYNDTILKYAAILNKLTLKNNDLTNTQLNSSTISLGEEVGYRWYFNLIKDSSKHRIYLEPSAEVVLGYVGNGSFDQANGNAYLNSAISNILAFRGRAGGVIGYSLLTAKNQTDFRLGLSYVGDFFGGGKMDFTTNFSNATANLQANQMALLSIGVNSVLSDSWRVYADVDTSFGGQYYNQNYLVSIGGRYGFGKKGRVSQPKNTHTTKVAKLAKGFYWEVLALPNTIELTQAQADLLKNYPYGISYGYQDIKTPDGKVQKVLFKYYLLGGFKSQEGALKSQQTADGVAKILNGKAVQA